MKYSVDALAHFLTLHIRGCDALIVLLTLSDLVIIMDITMLILDEGVSGEIPPEIGNLVNLTYIRIGAGELIGELPIGGTSPEGGTFS